MDKTNDCLMITCNITLTILTYNSSVYINELLNSLTLQAATDIQLIISDDCSTDRTVEIIEKWILANKTLFFEIILITSAQNKGVVENKKGTFKYIKGEWTKGIAGDDILYPEAIKGIREDISKFKDSKIIVGKALMFENNSIDTSKTLIPKSELTNKLTSSEKIKNYLFEGNTIPAITLLVKSDIFTQGNYFKHAKRNFEDLPFHLELVTNHIPFSFSENPYIIYRKHGSNLSSKNANQILSSSFVDYQLILLNYAFKNNKWIYYTNSSWNLILGFIILKCGNKGFLLKILNTFRRKLQPKRVKNMFFKPF
jgi:glycosyltransferase involved in cell wall biosynthesis